MLLPFSEPSQRILNDDNRAVDDQTEVERTKAHEVAGFPNGVHAAGRHQHGHRNDRRRDQRRADVAQQQEKHHDDEKRAFGQVLLDRRNGRIHQLRAVIDRLGKDVWRQTLVDLRELLRRAHRNDPAIVAHQHQDGRDHSLGSHAAAGAGADRATDDHFTDITHAHRHAGTGRNDRLLDFLNRLQARIGANQEALPGPLDVVGACRQVRPLQSISQFRHRQAIGGQRVEIGLHQILLHEAAVGIDAGHAFDIAHLRTDDPVLHGAQIGRLRQFGG